MPAILGYLETLPEGIKIGGAVFASGHIHKQEKDYYKIIGHFMDKPFEYEHIKKVCKNFSVIHGDNDDAVPLEQGVELSKNLGCELIIIPNGGHLAGHNGIYELPQALEALEKMF